MEEMKEITETCESCGVVCSNFKVVESEGQYIICPKCFNEREAMNKYLEEYMRKNNITMAMIEKEVRAENKLLGK